MNKIGYFDAGVVTPEEIIMAAGFTAIAVTAGLEVSGQEGTRIRCLMKKKSLARVIMKTIIVLYANQATEQD